MNKYTAAEKQLAELLGWTNVRWSDESNNLVGTRPDRDPEDTYLFGSPIASWDACGALIVEHEVNFDFGLNGKCAARIDAEPGYILETYADHPDKATAVRYAIVQAVIAKLASDAPPAEGSAGSHTEPICSPAEQDPCTQCDGFGIRRGGYEIKEMCDCDGGMRPAPSSNDHAAFEILGHVPQIAIDMIKEGKGLYVATAILKSPNPAQGSVEVFVRSKPGKPEWIPVASRTPGMQDADRHGDVLFRRSGMEMLGKVTSSIPVDATHWRHTGRR